MSDKGKTEMNPIEDAINKAIEECIGEGILSKFLSDNKDEVKDILLADIYEEKVLQRLEQEVKQE